MEKNNYNFAYIRVSSEQQSEERQIKIIKEFAEKNKIKINEFFIEKESGKKFENRNEWNRLVEKCRENDFIYITSIDRLSRNKKETILMLEHLKEKKINVFFIEQDFLNFKKYENNFQEIIYNFFIELYSMIAEDELKRIKERQKQGYAALKVDKKGRKIGKNGRVVGRNSKVEEILKNKEKLEIFELYLNKKMKGTSAAKILEISRRTLYNLKEEYEKINEEK